jgi:hypothetical protein
MILTLQDDGCIHVYDSPDAARGHVEALDAEDVLREVFDERGVRYSIQWMRRKCWFGLTNGEYRLVPSSGRDMAALEAMLQSAHAVFPESCRYAVEALKESLRGRL